MNAFSNLPPTTWALVAAAIVVGWVMAWAWGAYRQRTARKALIALTAAGGMP